MIKVNMKKLNEYDAIEAALEAASDYVSTLPTGQQKWDRKEYEIAKIAAKTVWDLCNDKTKND